METLDEITEKNEEWLSILNTAIDRLIISKDSFLTSLLKSLPPKEKINFTFYLLPFTETEKVKTEFRVPENLRLIASSYCLSFDHVDIVTMEDMIISKNIVSKIGKTLILGCLAKFEIRGKDLKNNTVVAHGIIFDPGWSIPININNVKGHDVLFTWGKEKFISFIDNRNFVLCRISWK
ncbi:hypothetical protein [Sulfolobus acidocaldarius]|uniref:Uncharacterized protein n=4 Tax=Sulfolobus acidocaldarius TaxID=2285 RepID=Q4JBD1_SULAC|nr:hypothetical protein [Sulfolobus acidocaldarius]AAY79898.1 hypothetical protein Saci_0492 [Sulfolobus acidocaldarius DSM 639]AGE70462.1 hypothetical protein SacN8_02410 [Sulfolobus acidocaldarius N8]AGE72736.1 hypothetical protein SacRon12I_02405 [Sulfolobus acidocaldarius Ron12/I]ALU29158.1 hypothetical protein ATY89_03865 [Sulfolobus acidocaldarius]ALU31883.1 hypothetical protein ATZ20_06890 [Sulfolobus acidocaldarius]